MESAGLSAQGRPMALAGRISKSSRATAIRGFQDESCMNLEDYFRAWRHHEIIRLESQHPLTRHRLP
jgi:hypothetical protein